MESRLQVIVFWKLIKMYWVIIYIKWGCQNQVLSAIAKQFPFLSHCKVSCDSPCCTKIFGGENTHCICNIDTHENVNSDDEEQVETQK